jgi:Spy/CpxP family protein refolding chaperone
MRTCLRHGVLALALLGSVSFAAAQDKASEVGQNPAAQTPSGATPPSNRGSLNNQQMQGHNAGPWETTGSAKDGGPAASSGGGGMEPGGPPGATGQTMPSTRSSQNAAEDKRIIVEHTLNMNDEQKQKIAQLMAPAMSASTSGSGSSESLAVGNTLPASVTMIDFPPSVSEQMPEMQKYKYVQMPDNKLLIVEPNNRIVVGTITR